MNEAKQRIAKTSKGVAVVLKVSFILVAIGMGTLLLGMGFLTFAGSDLSNSLQQALTVVTPGTASAVEIAVSNLVMVLGLGIILLFATFMVLFTLHRLFANVSKEQTPFTETNVKIMKRVTMWMVIMCIVDFIVNGISDKLLTGATTFTLNYIWLIVASAVYCIALIFEYGCQLQQEADETL